MHENWCGKDCNLCDGCKLDDSIPCSPDCEYLGGDGTPIDYHRYCGGCDALTDQELQNESLDL